uniref:Uncharacterized protein n=1 Tax=Arundo donax TaxID=35708 RepID=A0A0A8ZYH8_ARUDO
MDACHAVLIAAMRGIQVAIMKAMTNIILEVGCSYDDIFNGGKHI